MRGANFFDLPANLSVFGSSPHARGKLCYRKNQNMGNRIIPACAGQTQFGIICVPQLNGSSPHARGKLQCLKCLCRLFRIIPACAGQTFAAPSKSLLISGSSPHARGKRDYDCMVFTNLRIIPACAGQTGKTSYGLRSKTDHPRMRGANALWSGGS